MVTVTMALTQISVLLENLLSMSPERKVNTVNNHKIREIQISRFSFFYAEECS